MPRQMQCWSTLTYHHCCWRRRDTSTRYRRSSHDHCSRFHLDPESQSPTMARQFLALNALQYRIPRCPHCHPREVESAKHLGPLSPEGLPARQDSHQPKEVEQPLGRPQRRTPPRNPAHLSSARRRHPDLARVVRVVFVKHLVSAFSSGRPAGRYLRGTRVASRRSAPGRSSCTAWCTRRRARAVRRECLARRSVLDPSQ